MDINKLLQQAQQMQKQIEQTTDKINEMEFEAEASNGLVKVVVNGENKILKVEIDPSIIKSEDKEMLEDLIMIAINNAMDKIDEQKKNSFGSMASALGIPVK